VNCRRECLAPPRARVYCVVVLGGPLVRRAVHDAAGIDAVVRMTLPLMIRDAEGWLRENGMVARRRATEMRRSASTRVGAERRTDDGGSDET